MRWNDKVCEATLSTVGFFPFVMLLGLEIEKKMTCQTKFFLEVKYHLACHFISLPAKNGEVSYVVEMNVFMIYFTFITLY